MIKKVFTGACFLLGCLFNTQAFSQSENLPIPPQLDRELKEMGSPYSCLLTDLDEDNDLDALVVFYGRDFRGTGGCTLIAYRNTGESYDFIGRIPTVDVPVYLRKQKSQGMFDLVVYRRGLARVDGELGYGHLETLRFDGTKYRPEGTEPSGTVSLLESDQLVLAALLQP